MFWPIPIPCPSLHCYIVEGEPHIVTLLKPWLQTIEDLGGRSPGGQLRGAGLRLWRRPPWHLCKARRILGRKNWKKVVELSNLNGDLNSDLTMILWDLMGFDGIWWDLMNETWFVEGDFWLSQRDIHIYTPFGHTIKNIREQSFMFYSCLGVPVRWVWTTPIFGNKLGM